MNSRSAILGRVRNALKSDRPDSEREAEVSARLENAKPGLIPARGQLPLPERIALFRDLAEKSSATLAQLDAASSVPQEVARYLRDQNLAPSLAMGSDPRLVAMEWDKVPTLEILRGATKGHDEVGISHAFGAIAETGTLVLLSGPENPTSINFLTDHHIVVVDRADLGGDMESIFARLRALYGKGNMPRTINMIGGPSRSADVEQTIVLGAHGPRALHIIIVGDDTDQHDHNGTLTHT